VSVVEGSSTWATNRLSTAPPTLRARQPGERIFPPDPSAAEDRLAGPLPGLVLFLFLLGLAALSIILIRPPAPLPESAPADRFSAARALPHIQALAARPRPVGSPAHAEAQAYLIRAARTSGAGARGAEAVSVSDPVVANVGRTCSPGYPALGAGGKPSC